MPGLHLYRSNLVEALAGELGELLREPLANPLQPEIVVVQSMGMRRWLSFQIAAQFGIAMNCEFPFFAAFAQRVFRVARPGRAYSREAMLWRTMSALPQAFSAPGGETLRRYIGKDLVSPVKEYQLARQVASLFDQYLVHTPEELLQWEAKKGDHWQARLWRELVKSEEEPHLAALLRQLQEREGEAILGLPERISVFGIASLPKLYLQLLAEVSRASDVHLFLFEPTDQFWGDIRSQAEQQSILRRHGKHLQTAEDLFLEAGNELLASLGRAGRAFAWDVLDLEVTSWHEPFQEPAGETTLTRVQADLFHLREPSPEGAPRLDASIQIHCCHGPMREVEVLHDQLLALFEKLPDLKPREILVTLPNVETHAPFIEAVFGSPESPAVQIPYTIADRSARLRNGAARAFLQMLDLHGGRFPSTGVLELLETRAVRERFGIEEPELETLRLWIERNNIRWGIDADHRASFGFPAFEQNSWRAGLDRMLLGYALPGDGHSLFEGVLPDPEIEGGPAELLGRLAEYVGLLFEMIPRLQAPRTLREWSETLGALVDAFFHPSGEDADDVVALRRMIGTLGLGFDYHTEPVDFAVVRSHLETLLAEEESIGGFLAGRVTFCSLKPMRSIPFRVICMLGMDDGAFPRQDSPIAFDLLAAEKKASARSRRDEDRQLFLESLLSARDVFYLSYTGLSAKDNSEAPPSVVVSELLDSLAATYPPKGDADPRERFITRHKLQPFSEAYFKKGGPLFSYSAENSHAALEKVPVVAGPCAGAELPPAEIDWQSLDLSTLIDFFCHPARHFVQKRLGARLPEAEEGLSEHEPMELNKLDEWKLAHDLAEASALSHASGRARAAGVLPAGHFGEAALSRSCEAVSGLLDRVEKAELGVLLPPLALSVAGPDWKLSGVLETVHAGGQRLISAWALKPKDLLRAWLKHLFLNAADAPRATLLFGSDATRRFEPVPEAAEILGQLMEIHRRGLRRPLPFFPAASEDFARRQLKIKSGESKDPTVSGREMYAKGERDDAYNELCFRHLETPCDEEWKRLALEVWGPFFEHSEGEKA